MNKIAILTSDGWFTPYAEKFCASLNKEGYDASLFSDHNISGYDVVFILSYFKIVPKEVLSENKHNLVVHESGLPKGKGWSPLFWQVISGKSVIPVVLFEAVDVVDAGDIYIKDALVLEGHELNDEIRDLQASKTIELCWKFLGGDYERIEQVGESTFYPRRSPKDSELDVNKTIAEQFDLLRTVNNDSFPAFFKHGGHEYVLSISKRDWYTSGGVLL